jgi:hypothetical protein
VFHGSLNSFVWYSSWARTAHRVPCSSSQERMVRPATSQPALIAARMSLVDGISSETMGATVARTNVPKAWARCHRCAVRYRQLWAGSRRRCSGWSWRCLIRAEAPAGDGRGGWS